MIQQENPPERPNQPFMAIRITRREFAKLAATGAAGLAVAPLLGGRPAQEGAKEEPPGIEDDLRELEAKLAEPLSGEARAVARRGLVANRRAAARRWEFKLPENSEPCTIFVPAKV